MIFASVVSVAIVRQLAASENVTFTDVIKESKITFSHVWSPDKKYIVESMSGGVALLDFDKDGLLDIYFVNSPTVETASNPKTARSELWRNRGDGTYIDVTDKAGVGYPGGAWVPSSPTSTMTAGTTSTSPATARTGCIATTVTEHLPM